MQIINFAYLSSNNKYFLLPSIGWVLVSIQELIALKRQKNWPSEDLKYWQTKINNHKVNKL